MSEENLSSCDVVVTAKKRRMKIKLQRFFLILKTSRDRPKSAPYPRLKNSKKTSKCQVFFYSTRKSKIFRKIFFEKITY